MRDIIDPHLEKLHERMLRQGDVDPKRLGNIIDAITICVYQRRVPVATMSVYVPIDTLICRDVIKAIVEELPEKSIYGILNYCITTLLTMIMLDGAVTYNKLQSVIETIEEAREYVNEKSLRAMLKCVEFEFYRRVVGPHEDKKMLENGDVY